MKRQQLKAECARLAQNLGRAPTLAVILVGDDPASQVYVANKIKACSEVGLTSVERRLPANTTPAQLKAEIEKLNVDPKIDGLLLQLPLPKGLSADEALAWIDPGKDADCLTVANQGRLWAGEPLTQPCTPSGVMEILKHYKIDPAGKNAVVIGRSAIVGRPMAQLLTQVDATVTVCHSKTKDLRSHLLRADLVVVAAGRPEFLGKDDFKPGSVVVDVGIHRNSAGKVVGDVRWAEIQSVVSAATPVPGGVGPMTITMLLANTLHLAAQRLTT